MDPAKGARGPVRPPRGTAHAAGTPLRMPPTLCPRMSCLWAPACPVCACLFPLPPTPPALTGLLPVPSPTQEANWHLGPCPPQTLPGWESRGCSPPKSPPDCPSRLWGGQGVAPRVSESFGSYRPPKQRPQSNSLFPRWQSRLSPGAFLPMGPALPRSCPNRPVKRAWDQKDP